MGNCIPVALQIIAILLAPPKENAASSGPTEPTNETNNAAANPTEHNSVTNNTSSNPGIPTNVTNIVSTPSTVPAGGTNVPSVTPCAPANVTNDGVSPIYKNLPDGAEMFKVRNVYDGDTLTLVDERRVRLLGIDCPEVKEKQAFSQEAKEYTKKQCHQKDIWISFQPNGDQTDHYGRLLAFVWVEDNGGYLCVNEGIVAAGLASVYKPNADAKVSNWDKLLALQSQARVGKKGLWSTFVDCSVYKTSNGSAYHKKDCEHVANSRLTELKASEAAKLGLHPCRTCLADA